MLKHKKGVGLMTVISGPAAIIVLAITLIIFSVLFFALDFAKSADITIKGNHFADPHNVNTLINSPYKDGTLSDLFIRAYLDSSYENELRDALTKRLEPLKIPEENIDINGWDIRVYKFPENKEIKGLRTITHAGLRFTKDLTQYAVIPLPEKQGALKVELVLNCPTCDKDEFTPFI